MRRNKSFLGLYCAKPSLHHLCNPKRLRFPHYILLVTEYRIECKPWTPGTGDWQWAPLLHILTSDKVQYTTSSMMCCKVGATTADLKFETTPVKIFCGTFKQKVTISYQILLLEMNPGVTTTSRKRREQTKNGAITPHRNQGSFELRHLQGMLFWLSFGMKEALL